MPKTKKRKRAGWTVLIILVILLVIGFVVVSTLIRNRQANLLANIHSIVVQTGTIEKSVSGSGHLAADLETLDVEIRPGLKIDQVNVETGSVVKAGDILATFDQTELRQAIRDAQTGLAALDAKLNLLKGRTESLYITAPLAGRVKEIFLTDNDQIADVMLEHGALLTLSLDGLLQVTFVPGQDVPLQIGDDVQVVLDDQSEFSGTVQSLTMQQCVVTLSDKTAPINAMVTIELADGTKIGQGTLFINQPLAVVASSGQAKSVLCEVNDRVAKGTRLIKLEQAETDWDYAALYEDRLVQAEYINELLRYQAAGGLTAPADGTVRSLNLIAGKSTGSGAAAAASGTGAASADPIVACSLETGRTLRLDVAIDELDIRVLRVGQPVQITLDALPDLTVEGMIDSIPADGTVSQGSTTYTVSVSLDAQPAMKAGMSATAVVTVERRENIVRLPLEALQELGDETFVYVGLATNALNLGEKRTVQIGISDGQYVEIKSGLAAGEQVNYYYNDGTTSPFPFGGRFANRVNGSATTAGNSGAASNE